MTKFPARLTMEALKDLQGLDTDPPENTPSPNSAPSRTESEMTDYGQTPQDLNRDNASTDSFQDPLPEIMVPEKIVPPNDQEPAYDGDISGHQTTAPRWERKRGKQGGKNTNRGRARRRQQQLQHSKDDDGGDDENEEDKYGEEQHGKEKDEDEQALEQQDPDQQDPDESEPDQQQPDQRDIDQHNADQRNDDKSEWEHQEVN